MQIYRVVTLRLKSSGVVGLADRPDWPNHTTGEEAKQLLRYELRTPRDVGETFHTES